MSGIIGKNSTRGSGAIGTGTIGADAVTGASIADDAIDSEHYTDASIDNAHLADDAVGVAELSATGTASSSTYLRGDNAWGAISTPITALNNATANELVTVGSTTTELDAEANLTWDGETLYAAGNNDPRNVLHLNNLANANSDLTFRNNSNSWNIYADQMLTFNSGISGAGSDAIVFYTNGGNVDEQLRIHEEGSIKAHKSVRVAQAALTSSSNAIAWNSLTQQNCYHLTTENTTFSAPSNSQEGAVICVEIAQGGTARTIAWNTVFEFAASTAPTITATANKTDILTFRYNGSVWQEIGRVQNMAQT